MDERMRFVIRLKDGRRWLRCGREFGISRKTGYKIFERYQQCGLEGLSDRARRLDVQGTGRKISDSRNTFDLLSNLIDLAFIAWLVLHFSATGP